MRSWTSYYVPTNPHAQSLAQLMTRSRKLSKSDVPKLVGTCGELRTCRASLSSEVSDWSAFVQSSNSSLCLTFDFLPGRFAKYRDRLVPESRASSFTEARVPVARVST